MSGMIGEARSQAKHKSVEWYTPKWIFDELAIDFDLDPSSPHDMDSMVPAKNKYTVFDDGLSKPWGGRVWMNPPYGTETEFWVNRFIDHGNGIALLFSRTDAKWCQNALRSAHAVLFLAGRVEFIPGIENQHKKSRCGAGTVMFAYGDRCVNALNNLAHRGSYFTHFQRVKS